MLELCFLQRTGKFELRVDVTVPAQGVTAIFGVSGAGKTTLINAIAGLTQPDPGRIVLNGRVLYDSALGIVLPACQRRVGYVFQEARLFLHYRVRGNLRYGMDRRKRDQFDMLVDLLGIESLLDRFPHSLSGGEKQRVAIGRALLTSPEILLMDEPLAALDLPRKRELLPYLQKLARQVNVPILYVSHSLDEILQLADNLLVLERGQVNAFGPLATVWNNAVMRPWLPLTERSTVLYVRVARQHSHYRMTGLSLGEHMVWVTRIDLPVHTPLRIRIDSRDIFLSLHLPVNSSVRNVFPAQVEALLEIDHQIEVRLRIGQHQLWAQITHWACDELKIKPGIWLFALIKSVSLTH